MAQYQAVNQRATNTASTPFQQYGGEFVAPINTQQQAGITETNRAADTASPYFAAATGTLNDAQAGTTGINQAATGLAAASAGQVNPSDLDAASIQKYLSPYLGTVLGSESALLNQNNQQQQAGQLGTAISSGAFGGDRTGLAAANLEQQQNLANANIYSNILNQGYGQALSTAQQQQGVGLAAGQANRAALANAGQELSQIGATQYGEGANTATTLAGLGTGRQTAGLQGAQAQLAAGTVQQQTQQAQDTALYNQFLQQQSYPFQVDQFLANIAEGTGALSGSTTTTQQPGGFFSDEWLKEDMEPIGKTFDGQPIYRYKMKGDHRDQIGLSAQEVEKKHPHAVGLAGGYRWVDYGKATEAAANRGHFSEGGGVSGGGRVWRPAAYASGGSPAVVDQYDLQAILAAQNGMYAPLSNGAGVYGSTGSVPRGGSSRVPAPTGATPHLVTASGGLRPQQTPMENAKAIGDLGHQAAQLYKDYKSGHPENDETSTPSAGLAPEPAETPGDRARGGRTGYDDGGSVVDFGSILNAQQRMYQNEHRNRDIPSQGGGGGNQLAVASGSPTPAPSGASNLNQGLGLARQGYSAYKHFTKPPPTTTPAATTPGAAAPAADTSGLGAAAPAAETAAPAVEAAAPAAEVAAPSAASAGAAAGAGAAGTAAGTAATGALMAGGTEAAAAETAAAIAAEYAAAAAGTAVLAAKRGGRIKFAAGGMPYQDASGATPYQETGGQMDIPDAENTAHVQTAGPIKKQPTGLQTLMMMGDPNKAGGIAGGVFSNTALARGGVAGGRQGMADGGDPDDPDVLSPQGIGRGIINRKPNAKDLMYTRDAGFTTPYAAPGLKGGNVPPGPVDPDVAAYTGGNYGANADSAWTPPGSVLSTRGATGSWDDSGAPPVKPRPVVTRAAAPATGLGGASAGPVPDQGPPKLERPQTTYTGGVGLSPTPSAAELPPTSSQNTPVDKPSWWDKIKGSELAKPENLIPLLTAIGAMGTAPTRSLGVAASSGLLAGAQSYLPTRQELADIQQTGQQTERIGAETQGQKIQNIGELKAQYAYRGMALYPDPNGPITAPDGKRYVARPLTASMGTAQPTDSGPQYKMIGKDGVQTAHNQTQAYFSADPTVQTGSNHQIDQINEQGNTAQSNAVNLQRWASSVASNPQGLLAPGALMESRLQAVNMFNTAMDLAHMPQNKIDGLADAQMADKTSRGAAAFSENEHQQRSFGALKAFLQSTPNTGMQRDAALALIADVNSENQQTVDKRNYLNEVDQEVRRNGAPPRSYIAQDALNAYNREYSQDNYQGERNKFEGILKSKKYPELMRVVQNGTPAEKQKLYDDLDKAFGKNFHRYFTGGN